MDRTDDGPLERVAYRPGGVEDLGDVCALFRDELLRDPRSDQVAHFLADWPSALAHHGEALVGFAYCAQFAPDILELSNILVAEGYRGRRIGSGLLEQLESAAKARGFRALILVNSDLYPPGRTAKRSASGFYLRNCYELLCETGATRVFFKFV